MHPSTLRLSTLSLFALLTLSSALPAPGSEYSPDLLVRGGPDPDGRLPSNYVSQVKVRSEEMLDPVYQHPRSESGTLQIREPTVETESDLVALESRQVVEAAMAAVDVAGFVIDMVKGIKAQVTADNLKRGAFTQETVAQGSSKYPQFNWVACHTKHDKTFAGTEGKDWGHRHEEVDIKVGGTIGYEIYWFKEGTFKRQGDGGYLNWAYSGRVKETSNGGATVVFNP